MNVLLGLMILFLIAIFIGIPVMFIYGAYETINLANEKTTNLSLQAMVNHAKTQVESAKLTIKICTCILVLEAIVLLMIFSS